MFSPRCPCNARKVFQQFAGETNSGSITAVKYARGNIHPSLLQDTGTTQFERASKPQLVECCPPSAPRRGTGHRKRRGFSQRAKGNKAYFCFPRSRLVGTTRQ